MDHLGKQSSFSWEHAKAFDIVSAFLVGRAHRVTNSLGEHLAGKEYWKRAATLLTFRPHRVRCPEKTLSKGTRCLQCWPHWGTAHSRRQSWLLHCQPQLSLHKLIEWCWLGWIHHWMSLTSLLCPLQNSIHLPQSLDRGKSSIVSKRWYSEDSATMPKNSEKLSRYSLCY